MAKVKSSGLRGYVGRLGGSVYYMLNGQNIARELAPEVSNPRTLAQQRQRMQFANIVNMYRLNRPWMGRKSFENKKRTSSDYNAFVAANVPEVPAYLTKQEAAAGYIAFAPYNMTNGTLPEISVSEVGGNVFTTSLSVGGAAQDEVTSVSALSEILLANNSQLQQGDQISIIVMGGVDAPAGRPAIIYDEMIIDVEDGTSLLDLGNGLFGYRYINEGSGKLSFELDAPTEIFPEFEGFDVRNLAVAVVLSRTISGKTSVSPSTFALNTGARNQYAEYSSAAALTRAADSYGVTEEVFLDAGYGGVDGTEQGQGVSSVTGTYQAAGGSFNFTLRNGGRNTFKASTTDIEPEAPTLITFNMRQPWADLGAKSGRISVQNGPNFSINTAVAGGGVGNSTATFPIDAETAAQIEGRAATFEIFDNSDFEGTPYVLSVTA